MRHRVRDPGDFRDDTFRTKKLSSSAVRAVEVSFDISDAMAGGVSMIVGKLKEENVPEGNDANSMVLQAMRFARKTEDQDGWTSAQAKSWFAKSSFSKGEAAMSAVEPLTAGATAAPAAVVPTAPDAALTAERDRLAADNARLTADAAKAKRETDLAALKARFAGVKLPGKRVFAPAHASALADTAIEIAEDKREAHVLATIAALEHGQVEEGERGGSSPAQSGNLNHALFAAASRFAIGREYVYMANVRAGGGRIDVAAARQAVAQMGPLAASGVEIPSLSYQETMVLIESMFLAGYEEIPSLTSMFCNRVSRSTRTVDYRALGAPPRMREFFDERQHAVMNTKTPFPVTVRDWEASVAIPASEFQADLLGDYALAMQQMGGFAKQHPDELVAALIVAAETTLCYDGQNLCDTDHGEADSGTQSNFLTTGGDDDEIADVEADLNAGIAAMQRFKDDRGNNMRIGTMPNAVWDIVCRPEAYPTFNKLATATEISGTSNGWKGRLRITSLPDLTAADEWYLIYAGGIRKPLIVQFQNEPDALTILGADSEYCKINMKLLFMTQGNYTVAPADWRYILKVQKA
jgi:phage major head subunit gpT-like protein